MTMMTTLSQPFTCMTLMKTPMSLIKTILSLMRVKHILIFLIETCLTLVKTLITNGDYWDLINAIMTLMNTPMTKVNSKTICPVDSYERI